MTGKRAQELLDRVGITANKNSVPYDERPPAITSGVRLGTPAMTTRGFGPEEMREVGRDHRRDAHGRADGSGPGPLAGPRPGFDRRLPALSDFGESDVDGG